MRLRPRRALIKLTNETPSYHPAVG